MSFLSGARFVSEVKVRDYLLNPAQSKSGFFTRLGFAQMHFEELIASLSKHPADNQVQSTSVTVYGTKSVVECNIVTPDGSNPCIRTVWILEDGNDLHRFVTAYPARKKQIGADVAV